MSQSLEEMHEKAIEEIRNAYEAAFGIRNVPLDLLNKGSSAPLVYASIEEVVREWLARANAMSTFAVNVGLITGVEALEILQAFSDAHPEVNAPLLSAEEQFPGGFP